jgi:phosphoglycerate dehydrogenase-like enzyme
VPEIGPVVLGVLHPPEWFGDRGDLDAALDAVRNHDPRIEVIVETYEEGQHLRTLRGRPDGIDEARRLAPSLTAAQLAMFGRVHAVLAIDLPFAVGSVAPHLAWVQGIGSGHAHLESAGLAVSGIRLTHARGVNAVAIAEFVIGRLLAERKRFTELDAQQADRRWEPLYGAELAGSTIGLVGLGAINAAVAARLRPFGVEIVATRRSARAGDTAPDVDRLVPVSELRAMLGSCDVVICALPESPETIDLFDAEMFASMRTGSLFINVGRGSLVDESALLDALRTGHVRGAILDVQRNEPLPIDDPL